MFQSSELSKCPQGCICKC